MVLAAILFSAYLKVNDTKYIILSDRLEFSTHQLCKNKRDQNLILVADQSSMFHISTQDNYAHFEKNIFSIKNIYAMCNVQI